jgi:hypothetical protein
MSAGSQRVSFNDILFRAFQMPGCVKLIKPTTMTLNNGLLYQRVKRDTFFGGASPACSITGSTALEDILL